MGYTRAVIRARHLLLTVPTAPVPRLANKPTRTLCLPRLNPPLHTQPTYAPMARR